MPTLPLTNSQQLALVDQDDLQRCNCYEWFVDSKGYVRMRTEDKRCIFLHRFILGFLKSYTDHENRNKLDNRKENIRPCSSSQNQANRGKGKVGKQSQFKGVTRIPSGKWRATLTYQRKQQYLGVYSTEIEAARAYDEAAVLFFEEFAGVNI